MSIKLYVSVVFVHESRRHVAVPNRVHFVHLVLLARLVHLREQRSQHVHHLFRTHAVRVRRKSGNVRVQDRCLVHHVRQRLLVGKLGVFQFLKGVDREQV